MQRDALVALHAPRALYYSMAKSNARTIYVPESTWGHWRYVAWKNHASVSELIRRAVEAYDGKASGSVVDSGDGRGSGKATAIVTSGDPGAMGAMGAIEGYPHHPDESRGDATFARGAARYK